MPNPTCSNPEMQTKECLTLHDRLSSLEAENALLRKESDKLKTENDKLRAENIRLWDSMYRWKQTTSRVVNPNLNVWGENPAEPPLLGELGFSRKMRRVPSSRRSGEGQDDFRGGTHPRRSEARAREEEGRRSGEGARVAEDFLVVGGMWHLFVDVAAALPGFDLGHSPRKLWSLRARAPRRVIQVLRIIIVTGSTNVIIENNSFRKSVYASDS